VQDLMIEGKIPYRIGGGNTSREVAKGEDGLLVKAFVPSSTEFGYTNTATNRIELGASFDAFSDDASRIVTNDIGTPLAFHSRTPLVNQGNLTMFASGNNGVASWNASLANMQLAVRPVFALPATARFDSDGVLMPPPDIKISRLGIGQQMEVMKSTLENIQHKGDNIGFSEMATVVRLSNTLNIQTTRWSQTIRTNLKTGISEVV